jgi:hypothetical protein
MKLSAVIVVYEPDLEELNKNITSIINVYNTMVKLKYT